MIGAEPAIGARVGQRSRSGPRERYHREGPAALPTDSEYDEESSPATGVPERPCAEELERMAQRLREVDELSQFLVAMRDVVRTAPGGR